MFKGNGPSLRAAANATSNKSPGSVRGPAGQDGRFKTGGANDATSGAFRGARNCYGDTK
jgi:hypothetical protein